MARVVQVLPYVTNAVIDILESVVEVVADVILVVRWGFWLSIVPRIRRDYISHNNLSYHRQFRPSSFQNLVVMFRQVVVVRTSTLEFVTARPEFVHNCYPRICEITLLPLVVIWCGVGCVLGCGPISIFPKFLEPIKT